MSEEQQIKKYVPQNKWDEALARLKNGEPIQYIIGNVSFCGLNLDVDKRVLIPRFETEGLVAKTIEYAKKIFSKPVDIVDLGTGSGCIALALKKYLDASVDAIDISQEALEVARQNALKNNLEINFSKKNMEDDLTKKYDIIIANPPYIPFDGFVQTIVKNNEPNIALFASDKGLYFYKKILAYAFKYLTPKGFIAFEIGDNEKEDLEKYLLKNFPNKTYTFFNDLGGLPRYLFIFN